MAKLVTYLVPTVHSKGELRGNLAGYDTRTGRVMWAEIGGKRHKLVLQYAPGDEKREAAEALVHYATGARICDLNARRIEYLVGTGSVFADRTLARLAIEEIVLRVGAARVLQQFESVKVINP